LIEPSGSGIAFHIPVRENEDGRVNLESPCQYFGPFHAQVDSVAFDRRDRRLRDPGEGREFILAELLQLSDDSNRLADRDAGPLRCFAVITHDHFLS
jgi:hypothetical protein